MSFLQQDVYLYVFWAEDGRSTEEKIEIALQAYAELSDRMIPEKTVIGRTERRKPYLPEDADIGLSVSHSGAYFLCALTHGNVGMDLEQYKTELYEPKEEWLARLCSISRRFFHPEEAEFVICDPEHHFYKIWTAKESFVKFTGEGIDDDFAKHSVLPSNADSTDNIVRWEKSGVFFWQTEWKDDYTLCVCKEGPFSVHFCNMLEEI